MKDMKFIQLSLVFILLQLFLSLFLISGVILILYGIMKYSWFVFVLGASSAIFIGFEMYKMIGYTICFNDNEIFTTGDKQSGDSKIQHPVSIKYEDIMSLRVISSIENSKMGSITAKMLNNTIPKVYIEITTKQNVIERFLIFYHSRKQRVRILTEIKNRTSDKGLKLDVPIPQILDNVEILH